MIIVRGKSIRIKLSEHQKLESFLFLVDTNFKTINFILYSDSKEYLGKYKYEKKQTPKKKGIGRRKKPTDENESSGWVTFDSCTSSGVLIKTPQELCRPPSKGSISREASLSIKSHGSGSWAPEMTVDIGSEFEQKVDSADCPSIFVEVEAITLKKLDRKMKCRYYLDLHGLGVSLVDQNKGELAYISFKPIEFAFMDLTTKQRFKLLIGQFQIDVSLKEANTAIMIHETIVNEDDVKPFIQIALVLEKNSDKNLRYIMLHYISALIQEVDVRLEEELILALSKFFNDVIKTIGNEKVNPEKIFYKKVDIVRPPSQPTTFIDVVLLHLNPIALNLSIQLASPTQIRSLLDENTGNRLIGSVIDGISSISDVPFRFDALIVDQASGTVNTLLLPIFLHYKLAAVYQIYKVVGSLDLIGSPLQLISNLGEGVYSLFYFPAKGFVRSPEEFASGMSKGAMFFLHGSFQAVFGSASKITNKIAHGVSLISMDKEYIQKHKNKHSRTKDGSWAKESAANMGRGFLKGLTGIVKKPISGAKSDGFDGFLKGVGEGFLGAVSKPVVGVLDFVGDTLDGIADTTTILMRKASFIKDPKVKTRLVRFTKPGHLEIFNVEQARAQEIIKNASDPIVPGEFLLECIQLHSKALIISNKRVIFLPLKDFWGKIDKMLSNAKFTEFTKIRHVVSVDFVVNIYTEENGRSRMSFGKDEKPKSRDLSGVLPAMSIPCASEEEAIRVYTEVAGCVYLFFPLVFSAYFGIGNDWIDVTETTSYLIMNRESKALQEGDMNKLFSNELKHIEGKWNALAVLVVNYRAEDGGELQRIFFDGEPIVFI